jgi:EmrB/QacA subfamily drug resistance transporter
MTSQPEQTTKRVTLAVTALSVFITPFMSSSINVALPAMGEEFGVDAVILGWIASSYLLSTAMCVLPGGKLGDMYGRKRIFLYGIALYTFASLLSALTSSAYFLIGCRVGQGVGTAMIFGTAIAIVTSVFGPEERGKVLGMNVAATYSGLSLGPVLGGVLTQQFGWRSIFVVNVLAGLIILAGVFWKLTGEWAEACGETFDWVGAVLSALMLLAIIYGFSRLPAVSGVVLVGIGGALLGLFIWWELRVLHPLLNMMLFYENRLFAYSNLAALINYSATYAISFLLSLYLQYIKGLSPQQAGMVLIAQPVVMAVLSPVAGRLSDRFESRVLASIGMSLIVVGLLVFAFLGPDTPRLVITPTLMLLGLGFALFSSPNTHAIMSAVEKRFYGVASATLASMRSTGQALSLGVVMLIFTLLIGKVQITPEYYAPFLTSVRLAFGVFAGLCVIGVLASLARGNVR